jgi:hypothetical protein
MLPADAIGMLNVTNEIDTGSEHSAAGDIEIVDPERYHRACSKEAMEFVGWTIEFQNRTVGEPEPHEIIGLPGDRDTHDIPKQSNRFVQPITRIPTNPTFSTVIESPPACRANVCCLDRPRSHPADSGSGHWGCRAGSSSGMAQSDLRPEK